MARPPQLSAEAIRAAALDLVDEQGYSALTMRGLGARLGVKGASLYYHVPNRVALLRLIADTIAVDVIAQIGTARDWRELFIRLAVELRNALGTHPGATVIVATQDVSPQVFEPIVPVVLEVLHRTLDIADEDALYLVQSLYILVVGLALAQFGDASVPPVAPVEYYDAWFDIAVTTFLDGIAARHAR